MENLDSIKQEMSNLRNLMKKNEKLLEALSVLKTLDVSDRVLLKNVTITGKYMELLYKFYSTVIRQKEIKELGGYQGDGANDPDNRKHKQPDLKSLYEEVVKITHSDEYKEVFFELKTDDVTKHMELLLKSCE